MAERDWRHTFLRSILIISSNAACMLLAKFAVDVGEPFETEDVVVVEVVYVDAFTVGTAGGRDVLTISMRSSVVVSLISRLFLWLIF